VDLPRRLPALLALATLAGPALAELPQESPGRPSAAPVEARNDQAEKVANHLRDYWDPRMRSQICDHVAQAGEGLDDIAVRAVRMIS